MEWKEADLKISWMLAILGCVVTSCTSTRFVGQDATVSRNDTLTYAETQKRLRAHSGRVYLIGGQQVIGDFYQVTPDSVFILEGPASHVRAIPTGTIQRIEHIDRVGGFVGGLFGGTVSGLFAGAGVGALISAAKNERAGFGTAILAVLGAGVGALGGTVYGVSHGIVHVYQFREESVLYTTPEQGTTGTP